MDLRIVKTKQQIKQAFLSLRDQYTPEKIKVKDICERAMINKTTFYKHYVDSLALADEIEENCIEKLMSAFAEKKSLFESPKAYVQGLLTAVERQSEELRTVYKGRMEAFVTKLEHKLMQAYDGSENSTERRMTATFMISGMVHVLGQWLLSDEGKRIDVSTIAAYMERMTRSMLPTTT
ncbi:MAG: TetR/AcrR family transcriptional regulator [Clostridia bacterium]|nr:TetR/AcrR family transcriptional regulator [Clostridia bacterium]